jgi:eukaryotic-like serine/threonine-protein kinase
VGDYRWGRIQQLYLAALELPPSERPEFLSQACSNEPEVRLEVESLLAFEGHADGLLEDRVCQPFGRLETVIPSAEPLTCGSQLGAFRILELVGTGGMGRVYRATDTRLHRDVAIKVLPPEHTHQPEWLARLQREARAISVLNHSNICTLYDIGPNYLVMELVQGAVLAGPVPVDTAMDYARQIVAGLEAAHEHGIVHRDLKPANIKITPEGTVKILDFGLAKTMDVPASAAASEPALQPTEAGMILGTAAYMSPEQARGQTADRRADIWAFGVVFYELLTGASPFRAGNASESLAAVLTHEPDFNALPRETPPRARRLLELCLRKEPKLRLQAIGDARILLDDPEPGVPRPPSSTHRRLPWGVAGALAIALVAVMAWQQARVGETGPGAVRFLAPLPPGTSADPNIMSTHAVISPDGHHLVFVAREDSTGKTVLRVQPLDSTSAQRLDQTEEASLPFWSPDSQHIGFFAGGTLKRVAVSDGSVQTICKAPTVADGGAWNRDGVIVFATYGAATQPLMRVSASGGAPTAVTALEKGELWHSWPQFLPDGRHMLYFAVNKDAANSAIYVQALGSTERVLVLKNPTRGVWAAPGHLLFVREGTLFAQRMDPKTYQLVGEPAAIAQDVAFNERNGRNAIAASRNGVLVYRSSASNRVRQLTWYNREGKLLGPAGKPGEFMNPALSPDEKNVAMLIGPSGRIDVWVMNLASGVISRMTQDSKISIAATPVWSRDSQRLAISQVTNGIEEIDLTSDKITQLGSEALSAWDWWPDGSAILCGSGTRLFQLPAASGATPQVILDSPTGTAFRFSPDGRYVVYASTESGQQEIYVASFPTFAAKRKISSGGGRFPLWAKGGKEVFYRATDGAFMGADIRTGLTLEAGPPKLLFKAMGSAPGRFSVTADGKRFLIDEGVAKTEGEKPDITVVLNWAAGIR